MAKANVGERRDEPGVEDVFAALKTAARSTPAECARLADERKGLTSEINRLTAEVDELRAARAAEDEELRAARDKQQRNLTALQDQTNVEFLRRCVAGGIDVTSGLNLTEIHRFEFAVAAAAARGRLSVPRR